jgi:hypothetical protein
MKGALAIVSYLNLYVIQFRHDCNNFKLFGYTYCVPENFKKRILAKLFARRACRRPVLRNSDREDASALSGLIGTIPALGVYAFSPGAATH